MENNPITENDLLTKCFWDEIWEQLIHNYPQIIKEPAKESDYEEGYKAVYDKFHTIVRKDTDMILNIKEFNKDGVRGVDIFASNDECPEGYQ